MPPISGREWRWVAWATLPIIAATVGPVALVGALTPSNFHFLGFLYAWDDAAGYLAAMREGARGFWLFVLPFTATDTEPILLYPHYLFLGHLSAWLGGEPIVVFHAARAAAGAILLASLYAFLGRIFDTTADRRLAFLLAALGSGFGWLALIGGYIAPDIWQYEVSVFQAMLASPHFALSMACLLWLMELLVSPAPLNRREWLRLLLGATLLGAMQPYPLVVAGVVIAAWHLARRLRSGAWPHELVMRGAAVIAGAGPWALYYAWAQSHFSSFAGWQAQDVTLSPSPVDYVIAGGAPLALALVGTAMLIAQWRTPTAHGWGISRPNGQLLLLWLALGALMLYEPLTHHQRRFAFGLSIPVACLAVVGYRRLQAQWLHIAPFTLVVFCSLSALVLPIYTAAQAQQRPSYMFLSADEWAAFKFLRAQPPDGAVLASPLAGLFIPAWTDQRTVYGHPHMTLNAAATQQAVESYFGGALPASSALLAPVTYIFIGPRERAMGTARLPARFVPVFAQGDVTIYSRR
ncbi:MAG: hypothetical protein HZB53_16125 [Chloroflexi bacterium]|nr:hypothetical protein [Chloroflexota bacterium]